MTSSNETLRGTARIVTGVVAVTLLPAAAMVPRSAAGILAAAGLAALIALVGNRDARAWRMRWDSSKGPIFCLGISFLIWCALSAAWSPQPGRSLFVAGVVGAIWLGGWSVLRLVDTQSHESDKAAHKTEFGDFLLTGLGLGIAAALANWATGGAVYDFANGTTPQSRLYTPIYDRFGVVAALLTWPIVLAALPRFGRRAGIALALVALATVFAAANRSMAIAVGGGIVAAGLTLRWPRLALGLVMAGTMAAILLSPLVAGQLHEPASLKDPAVDSSADHRLEIWQFTSERIVERPFFGWGMDGARMIPGGTEEIRPNVARLPLHPHNAGLQWWLELGAVGALLGSAFLLSLLRAIGRIESPLERGFCLGQYVTGFGIASLSFGIWQAWWQSALWLAACLMLAAIGGRRAALSS